MPTLEALLALPLTIVQELNYIGFTIKEPIQINPPFPEEEPLEAVEQQEVETFNTQIHTLEQAIDNDTAPKPTATPAETPINK